MLKHISSVCTFWFVRYGVYYSV